MIVMLIMPFIETDQMSEYVKSDMIGINYHKTSVIYQCNSFVINKQTFPNDL